MVSNPGQRAAPRGAVLLLTLLGLGWFAAVVGAALLVWVLSDSGFAALGAALLAGGVLAFDLAVRADVL